jgi:excisionase family DNA binding protein
MPAVVDHSQHVSQAEPIFPNQAEHAILGSIEQALLPGGDGKAHLVGPDGDSIDLPESLFAVLRRAVHELRLGNGISILPVGAELTTREAAEILNVSRPFLIKLLEGRKMPFRKVGAHRRVRLSDLLAYKRRQEEERRKVLKELAEEAEEFGFYDDWPGDEG